MLQSLQNVLLNGTDTRQHSVHITNSLAGIALSACATIRLWRMKLYIDPSVVELSDMAKLQCSSMQSLVDSSSDERLWAAMLPEVLLSLNWQSFSAAARSLVDGSMQLW